MISEQKKLQLGLIVYTLSMAILLISRLLNFGVLFAFLISAVLMGAFSIFVKVKSEKEALKIKERKKTVYSSIIFSSGLICSIPLVLAGDYISAKLPKIGYDIAFLSGSISTWFLWLVAILSAVAYELFFRGVIYELFSNVRGKKIGIVTSCVSFAIFFLYLSRSRCLCLSFCSSVLCLYLSR